MKERLLKEIQKGSKSATMKKHVITYLIYNENATSIMRMPPSPICRKA